MIQFSNVSKLYGHQTALKDLSFSIDDGEMVFLTGHSGAGKTTVLKLAMRMESVSRGQIQVHKKPLNRLTKNQLCYLRRDIGFIFQNPHLLSTQTVFENVSLPLIISGYRQQDIKKRTQAALDKVGLLSKAKMLPNALSSGEQQRVGIARAVVNKPAILLADEPTGNLDPELSLEIFRLFEAFNAVGVTVLIATHDISIISKMKHRCIHLDSGALKESVQ